MTTKTKTRKSIRRKAPASATSSHLQQLAARALKNPIRKHLLDGRSVSWTAAKLDISTERIYEYAKRHNLPTNRPIPLGSPRHQQVLKALDDKHSVTDIATLLRVTSDTIHDLVKAGKALKTRARK